MEVVVVGRQDAHTALLRDAPLPFAGTTSAQVAASRECSLFAAAWCTQRIAARQVALAGPGCLRLERLRRAVREPGANETHKRACAPLTAAPRRSQVGTEHTENT